MRNEKLFNELLEMEMSEGCHLDNIEDYNSKKEFYLSNIIKDDYIDFLTIYENLSKEEATEMQIKLINTIENL